MIRGAIEVVGPARIAGWMHASNETLRDKLILAFVGPRCAGAGKIDRFRQDLLEAGLGDGFCGFDFPIELQAGEATEAVVVKLQNSDAALLQAGARLVAEKSAAAIGNGAFITAERLAWLADRGWLDQPEYDFLKAILYIGAYECALRPKHRNGESAAMQPPQPQTAAAALLNLYAMQVVSIRQTRIDGISDLAGAHSPLHGPLDVVGDLEVRNAGALRWMNDPT